MKNIALGAVLVLLTAATASAQPLRLPAASPAAKISQEVGVTDISLEYASPAVKGRKIWGDLVPFDKVWRTGANASTKITFSREVNFGGKNVPAGTYSLLSVPSQKGWKIMLNKELGLFSGPAQYDAAKDVVSVDATTTEIAPRERLAFFFTNTTDDSTSLDLEWEKLRVSVPIKVDTATHVQGNLKGTTERYAMTHVNAARYLADTTKDNAAALKHADMAVSLDAGNWFAQWTRADILARMGKYAEARKSAQTAWDLGEKSNNFFFRDQVQKALADWKNKK